jgi:adenosine deaminase
MEVRYSPILHQKRGLKLPAILEPVLAGLKRAERDFRMSTGVIICGMRNISPTKSYELAKLAVAYKERGVVAFDLAGEEKDHPARDHRRAFRLIADQPFANRARRRGLGPPSIAHAATAAHRIGHGTRCARIRACSTATPHPARGLPHRTCSAGEVDPTTVRRTDQASGHAQHRQPHGLEHQPDTRVRARHAGLRLSPYQVKKIIIAGFKSAFLPYAQKARLLRQVVLEIDTVFMDALPDSYDRAGSTL